METIHLAHTDIEVSKIGLGTWALGGVLWGGIAQNEPIATIRAALDRGVNLIDTAPVYGFGLAEELVGQAIAEHGRRDQIVIATKAGLEWHGQNIRRNSTPQRIREELEASLARLRTDYVDIYQIHWPDPLVPYEDTAEALYQLHQAGKFRAIGVSNFTVEQLEAFREAAPLHTVQMPYNLFERNIESDVLPYCTQHSIATLGYGSLCRGLLTGKLDVDKAFTEDDLRSFDPKFQPPHYPQYIAAVRELAQFAQENYGKEVLHLAIRWILDRDVDVALWGVRRPSQLAPLDHVFGWQLDSEAHDSIEHILNSNVTDPVAGPDAYLAPPTRDA